MIEEVPIVSNGLWLFRNHTVTFPSQSVDESLNKIFSVNAIKSNETRIQVISAINYISGIKVLLNI